jgi:xanthine dehydrogenase YagR molybdenum-binding subunit
VRSIDLVDAKLGDSTSPKAPVSGGSQSAASVTPAVQAADREAVVTLIAAATKDSSSPFGSVDASQLEFESGVIRRIGDIAHAEHFKDFLARNGNKPIGATSSAEKEQDSEQYSTHSWGAVFAEVGVEEFAGLVHVRRVVGVYDVGKLLNERTGKSQLIGGIVWGVGLALEEVTHIDQRYGRSVNNNLAEYHVPVNADIGTIEVHSLNIPDTKFDPLGARGIGKSASRGSPLPSRTLFITLLKARAQCSNHSGFASDVTCQISLKHSVWLASGARHSDWCDNARRIGASMFRLPIFELWGPAAKVTFRNG